MDGRRTNSHSPAAASSRASAVVTLADDSLPGPPVAEALERGATFDRYVVLEPIGSGAMGLVYAAYDPKLDRRIALKLLHVRAEPEVGTRQAQRLLREAQAMAQLTHPNVVTVHDVGTADGRVFLAMEYVEGQTLTRWLEQQRDWREVLTVFLAAGRGLQAAHAKALVHRDFKPDNVMLGDDGRVRVMDFGLARAGDDSESAEPAKDSSMRVTQTGALMGTPAYMAPEQHLGRAIDARSDQFSFCVALHEGLYGVRPFAGETVAAVGLAITQGTIRDPPPGRPIPRWLRRIVLRGLQTDPQERFADMQQLLVALQDDPQARRRRRLTWGVIAGLLAAVTGWNLYGSDQPPTVVPCRGAADHLEGIWDEARIARVAEAMQQGGSAMATDTFTRVRDRLDRYTDAWVQMHTDSCEATRIRAEQSEQLLDLRSACLDDRLQRVDSVVATFESADAEVLQRAVRTVADLPSLAPCADLDALRGGIAPPEDPATVEAVQEIREQVGRAWARSRAGRHDEATTLATALREQAEALGYRPVLAETEALEGELHMEAGDYAAAEAPLRRAYFDALSVEHDAVAARAAARLVYVVGYHLARHPEGRTWGEHALAMGLRVGEDDLAEAEARHNLGVLAQAGGDTAAADRHYERAHALRARLLPSDHPDLARSLLARGNVHLDRGEYALALSRYEEALRLREEIFGPHHPQVAATLNNVAITLRRTGELGAAVDALMRTVQIYESLPGPARPGLARALDNLGLALRAGGDPIAAEARHHRAIELREQLLGPAHPDVGDSLLGLGRALSEQGRHAEAEASIRRAITLYADRLGPDHPAMGTALLGLGIAQHGQGHPEAHGTLQRAVQILDATMPSTTEAREAHAWVTRTGGPSASP